MDKPNQVLASYKADVAYWKKETIFWQTKYRTIQTAVGVLIGINVILIVAVLRNI